MWRHLYSILLTLATPALIWHVMRKYGRQGQPAHIAARLGLQRPPISPGVVWIHACSLGESKVALALAAQLTAEDPSLRLMFTATTPAGLTELQSSEHSVTVFPWDLPWVWGPWLSRLQPRALVVIETELWPNLIAACAHAEVPVILANGRLSEKSFLSYQRLSEFTRPMWAGLTRALMQFSDDALRAHALGTPQGRIAEVGSVKLDQPELPANPIRDTALAAWKQQHGVVCLMSGHPGEDAYLYPLVEAGYRLLLVPRHPDRGDAIMREIEALGLIGARVSEGALDAQVQIVVGDTFGEMGSYLRAADVVVIGGSFAGHGGQNPVEPARLGKPIVAGPFMYNFAHISASLQAHGGLIQADPEALPTAVAEALDQAVAMGSNARDWVLANQGSTERQVTVIRSLLRPL